MTKSEAISICKEMQKWRRSEYPYDGDIPKMPYSQKNFGEAIDILINIAENGGTQEGM